MAKLKTGRHTSAIKENRRAKKREGHNKALRSKIRTLAKKVEEAVLKKDVQLAKDSLKIAVSEWDKASRRKVVHSNTAANKKAQLSKLVSSISA
ncbi:30S ribosomal protein S20 [Elusimicrobiota bacterium]